MKSKKLFVVLTLTLAMVLGLVAVSSAQGPSGSGWWAGFTIQNAESTDAMTQATAYWKTDGSADTFDSNFTLGGGNAVTFHPGFGGTCTGTPAAPNGCRISFTPDLAAGFEGSVVVSADSPIVAFANVNNNPSGSVGVSGGTARSGYQGTGGAVAADTLYFPTVKHNFAGQTTNLYVQAANADADVTINYKMENGATFSQNKMIEANKMYVFTPSAAGIESCNGGNDSKCIGGATVTVNNSALVAGSVLEYREGVSVAEYVLATRAMTPSDVGTEIVAPTMKNEFFGGTTGASILNTEGTMATVDLAFTVTNVTSGCSVGIGHTATDQVTIPANGSTVVSRFRGNVGGLPDCVFYAMTATSSGGQGIAITVNESQTRSGQTFKATYAGFNTAGATGTALFPLVKEDFVGNTTGVTLVNAGSVNTKIQATYTGSSSTHVLETIELVPGQAVILRQAYNCNSNPNYTAISGGCPNQGDKYAVTAVATDAAGAIVGLAQEASVSGNILDIYNVEGFNQ
jgi:hypothetical protein